VHLNADEYALVTPDGDSSSLHLLSSSPSSSTSSPPPLVGRRLVLASLRALIGCRLVLASLRLSLDVAQYLDSVIPLLYTYCQACHRPRRSPHRLTPPPLRPALALRESAPTTDHRPANRSRSSEKDGEGERGRTRAFAIAVALVVVVVVVVVPV
jgi:hypothetical protein